MNTPIDLNVLLGSLLCLGLVMVLGVATTAEAEPPAEVAPAGKEAVLGAKEARFFEPALNGGALNGGACSRLPAAPMNGLWVWRSHPVAEPEARAKLLAFAVKHKFNLLMVQIHFAKAEPGNPGPRVLRHPEGMAALIKDAAALGIRVEGLDGGPDMGRAANHATTMALLDAILAFDRTLPAEARLAGMHYDIEPHALPAWKTPEREAIMKELLAFYAAAGAKLRLEAPHMTLAVDIPFWLDNKTEEGDSCIVEYMGVTKNLHQHIQDLTDYVGIMSYRRAAVGNNSIVSTSRNELDYAAKIGRKVMPGMETGEVKESPTISFFGLPAEKFWEQKQIVEQTLADDPAYAGVLVHSYERLRELVGE